MGWVLEEGLRKQVCWRPVTKIGLEGEVMEVREVGWVRWVSTLSDQVMGVICLPCQSRPHPLQTPALSLGMPLTLLTALTQPRPQRTHITDNLHLRTKLRLLTCSRSRFLRLLLGALLLLRPLPLHTSWALCRTLKARLRWKPVGGFGFKLVDGAGPEGSVWA